jgi:hypothetical protein
VRTPGRLTPTVGLVRALGLALRVPAEMDRPILCADLRRGAIELRARVSAPSRRAGRRIAAQTLYEAFASAGVDMPGAVHTGPSGLAATARYISALARRARPTSPARRLRG